MPNLLTHIRRPDISFRRSGQIRISARLVRMLSLRPGDSINIDHDGCEFYLHKVDTSGCDGSFRARCYPTQRGSNNYTANSTMLCIALLERISITADKVSFTVGQPISRDNKLYIPIITKHPL